MKNFTVYILGNNSGTLYIGVTSALSKRMAEHRQGVVDSFSSRYKMHKLLYFESHPTAESAITREKRLKHWKREWKLELIRNSNPEFVDLTEKLEN